MSGEIFGYVGLASGLGSVVALYVARRMIDRAVGMLDEARAFHDAAADLVRGYPLDYEAGPEPSMTRVDPDGYFMADK